jgi:hypothetical protein
MMDWCMYAVSTARDVSSYHLQQVRMVSSVANAVFRPNKGILLTESLATIIIVLKMEHDKPYKVIYGSKWLGPYENTFRFDTCSWKTTNDKRRVV